MTQQTQSVKFCGGTYSAIWTGSVWHPESNGAYQCASAEEALRYELEQTVLASGDDPADPEFDGMIAAALAR